MTLVAHYPLDTARMGIEYGAGPLDAESEAGIYYGSRRPCAGPLDRAAARFDGGHLVMDPEPCMSIATTGALSVSIWVRPDRLVFPHTDGGGHVPIVSKLGAGANEWCLRMYSANNTEGRGNRVSAYAFNATGGLGAGSYFQDALTAGQWMHVVATYSVADDEVSIWRDGVQRDRDTLSGYYIKPTAGNSPLMLASRGAASRFHGALSDLRIFDHVLTATEIAGLTSGEAVAA